MDYMRKNKRKFTSEELRARRKAREQGKIKTLSQQISEYRQELEDEKQAEIERNHPGGWE